MSLEYWHSKHVEQLRICNYLLIAQFGTALSIYCSVLHHINALSYLNNSEIATPTHPVISQPSLLLSFTSLMFPLSLSLYPANSISAGQLLCGGLFSADSLSNWCAAVALGHALQDNLTQKEQLLRVQLATSLGKPPVSLLQQCTNILSQVTCMLAYSHIYTHYTCKTSTLHTKVVPV